MSDCQLFLLSPYRFPGQDSTYLSDEDVRAFLNAYAVLWHPASLLGRTGPPRIDSPYDHENPLENTLYSTPIHPPLLLPEDWKDRVRQNQGIAVMGYPDRQNTFQSLQDSLRASNPSEDHLLLLDLPADKIAPFTGIGLGYVVIDALYEAMSHEHQLDKPGFWKDVQEGLKSLLENPQENTYRIHLQSAADKLQAAREVLYPVTIHVVDFLMLEEQESSHPWKSAWHAGLPMNVIASVGILRHLQQHNPEVLQSLREKVANDHAEVCGGCLLERADSLLPLESQLWNLRQGQQT